MEEKVRRILRAALAEDQTAPDLVQAIRRRFEHLGGLELQIPPREQIREPPVPGR